MLDSFSPTRRAGVPPTSPGGIFNGGLDGPAGWRYGIGVGLGMGVDMGQNWNLGSWHSKFQRENQGFSGWRESTRAHRHTVSLTQSLAF